MMSIDRQYIRHEIVVGLSWLLLRIPSCLARETERCEGMEVSGDVAVDIRWRIGSRCSIKLNSDIGRAFEHTKCCVTSKIP